MHTFVALQSTYETVQIGIFKDNALIDFHESHKYAISKELIVVLVELLEHHGILLPAVDFIVVNTGPGPFTTVRALLSTVNGINFATHTPLVGVDGLALLIEGYEQKNQSVIALINAFNNDVYYGYRHEGQLKTGWDNIELTVKALPHNTAPVFVGNGAHMHKELILSLLPKATILDEASSPTIEELGKRGLEQFTEGHTAPELFPLYLKTLQYKAAL